MTEQKVITLTVMQGFSGTDANTNKSFQMFELNLSLSDWSHNEKPELQLNKDHRTDFRVYKYFFC